MTVGREAQKHIAKAQEYLAKGDEFYRHAAAEMELAVEAGASHAEIGDAIGRSKGWVQKVVSWSKDPANPESAQTPFGGEKVRDNADRYATRKVLSDPVKVTEIVNALPKEAVYAIEEAVANRLGSPIIGDKKLAGDPIAVVRAFDKLTPEQQEMASVDIAQTKGFTEALKHTPEVRDEVLVRLVGSPSERKERKEENQRKQITKNPIHGWGEVNEGLGDANRGLIRTLDALVKLAMYTEGGFNADDDPLGVSFKRAEGIGRSIYEIEQAWGLTPISDRIATLREENVARNS